MNYFPNTDDWPRLFAAWTDALQDEHRRILEVIPAEDLVVQLDYCIELELMTGSLATLDRITPVMVDEAFDRYTSAEYVAPHFAALPDAVRVGRHICLGTFLGWPRVPISDMQFIVHALAGIQADGSISFTCRSCPTPTTRPSSPRWRKWMSVTPPCTWGWSAATTG